MLSQLLVFALLSGAATPGTVGALPPNDSVLLDEELADPPRLVVVDEQHRMACPRPGTVCPFPGGGSTVYVAEFYADSPRPTIGLTRASRLASMRGFAAAAQHDPWRVDVVADLKDKVSGRVVVAIFDAADASSIARREAKLVWDLDVNQTRWLGLKALLDPATFRPGHTYLIRFAQPTAQHERTLAEGALRLE